MPSTVSIKKAPAVILEARQRWNRCNEAEQDQRTRTLLAKQFRAGDQWPNEIKIQRAGGQSVTGMPPMPPQPCLTIDRLSQPCRQVSNQIKTANFAIDVLPNGFGSDTETANIFKGYLRYVQNRARGESPVEWAADQAIEGGFGWFRIRTEYVYESPEGVPPEALFDQEIRLERIANNLTVYCDPWSVKPTRSDAQFMFVTEDMSKDEFTRRYKDADLVGLEDFAATGDCPKGWVDAENIRIAEYWRITYDDQKIKGGDGRERVFRIPVVKGSKITATEELETWEWVGSRIPLIPVIGEELNIDGRSFFRGLIEPGMDAQRMVNYTYSGAISIFSLGSKSQRVVADDQVADYKSIWDTANIYPWSYLPYKPMVVAGTMVPPPQLDAHEAPIQAAAMLLQVSEDGIKATTGWYDSGLGANTQRTLSGRAKQSEIQQSELGSSNYPDNVRRALIYAGELMVEIAPKITRPGQLLQIIGADDQPEQVMVGQPFVQQNGQAMPVPPGQEQQYEKGMVKFYDFTKGRYAVTVAVGKAAATKREEGAAAIGELIPNLPPAQAAVLAPEYVEQLSFEGSQKAAELMRKALPPELRQDEEEGGPDPEKQMLMQQVQQLQQALEGKQAEEQAKQQAQTQRELTKAQMDGQTAMEKARIDAMVRIEVAKINAQAGLTEASIKAGTMDQGHQVARDEQLIGNDHELRVQAIDHDHERELASLSHEQALEQGAQAAALQPEPAESAGA